jgi:uncharacterized protein
MPLTIEAARPWYPDHDPVHGFDHILRVYALAERICQREGADWEIVRAAVLLHDATPPEISEQAVNRESHHYSSAEYAAQILQAEGWQPERIEEVCHCIRAHRFRDDREAPQTLEAKILFDADKLDAIGAIGVARAVAYAARSGNPPYWQVSEQFINTGQREPGELHSSYHEFIFKLRKLRERLFTPTAKTIGEERHRFMQAFYERLEAEVKGLQ